ncbi:MAG TPA: hypothetical protein VIT91_09920 [Chthoniobacterales bacterium]
MLDKGRRYIQSREKGHDLLNGFLFGDVDFSDWRLLRFLRTNERRLCQLLKESQSDELVANTLIAESGRTADDIAHWNRRFPVVNVLFIPMWNADEDHRQSGPFTEVIKVLYNWVVMPPVALVYRISRSWKDT